jgi:hypothetical protein
MHADQRLAPSDIERARSIAAAAVHNDPRGCAGVADRCGATRSAISMFSRGKYPAGEQHLARQILIALDGWTCPYTQAHITPQDCRAIALAPAPTHNPARMTHWRACLHCPGRPEPLKED